MAKRSATAKKGEAPTVTPKKAEKEVRTKSLTIPYEVYLVLLEYNKMMGLVPFRPDEAMSRLLQQPPLDKDVCETILAMARHDGLGFGGDTSEFVRWLIRTATKNNSLFRMAAESFYAANPNMPMR